MKKNIILILIIMSVLFGCVSSKDVQYLDERIAKLEQITNITKEKSADFDTRIKKYRAKDLKFRKRYANLRVDHDNLKDKFLILKGNVERYDYLFNRQNNINGIIKEKIARLKKENKKLTTRIIRLEKFVEFDPSKKSGENNNIDTKKLSEQELYDRGKKSFDKGNLKYARDIFQNFLKLYPKSDNADNSQFWISEIYYQEKWYEKAILEYQKVIEIYPKGNKVPPAYLKQGYSFENLGEKDNARLILKKLIKKFPKSNEAKLAKKKLKRLK